MFSPPRRNCHPGITVFIPAGNTLTVSRGLQFLLLRQLFHWSLTYEFFYDHKTMKCHHIHRLFFPRVKFLLIGFLFWQNNSQAAEIPAYSQAARKIIPEIIICARTIVEKRLGNIRAPEIAAKYLSETEEVYMRGNDLQAVLDKCLNSQKSLQKGSLSSDIVYNLALSLDSTFSERVKLFVMSFAKPRISAHKIGVAVSGAYFGGIGIKIDGSYCLASNGRQWLEVSPGVGVGGGLGFNANVNVGTLKRDQLYKSFPIDFSSTTSAAAGYLAGGQAEWDTVKEENTVPTPDVYGIGVAYGITGIISGQMNLKVLPVGTSRDYLFTRFVAGINR
jgi:hypothetical protein